MIPTRPVPVALYRPAEDSHGAPIDAWAPAADVDVYGWQTRNATGTGGGNRATGNRRPITTELDVLAPAPEPGRSVGGHRAKWRLAGDEYEQIGDATAYNTGPFWTGAGVTVRVRKVRG